MDKDELLGEIEKIFGAAHGGALLWRRRCHELVFENRSSGFELEGKASAHKRCGR
jgi:hypothetical protein